MADHVRRGFMKVAAAATAFAVASSAAAQDRTDDGPRELEGKAMPEPPAERNAGPIRAGRGSVLQEKVAVVTGAARDISGPVSPASNAAPATPEDLDTTVRMVKQFGRRSEGIRADIRDIGALRQIADRIERDYGKIDIVVANAAIQRWMPLLEMQDSDRRDVIETT
ncbi:SDR family NAD(P)-dependent oxidoreductase [Bradyrhizobium sp. USDA 4454]